MTKPSSLALGAVPPITPIVGAGVSDGDGDDFDPQVVELGNKIHQLPLKLVQQLFRFMKT